MTDEIAFGTTGELCPICEHENEITVDYREVVKVLKGDSSANIPLIHCEECGNRLAPCSFCKYAIQDGYITFDEMTCDNCPITKYWDNKYGEDKHGDDEMTDEHGDDPMTTDEKKTPAFDEITKSFFDKCELNQKELYNSRMDCPHCDYRHLGGGGCEECNGGGDSQGECLNHYIYDVATGARDINKPLWNPPKVELPEWFQDGVLVFDEELNRHLKVIDYETLDDNVVAVTLLAADGETHQTGAIPYEKVRNGEIFKPVKFRPYKSLEELEALLGKKLRSERKMLKSTSTVVETITSVEYDPCNGDVDINNRPYEFYSQNTTTIDGLPIGVPEVDEEAMKGGAE